MRSSLSVVFEAFASHCSIAEFPPDRENKFVRTKIRLKLGTKIDLSERFVRFVRLIFQMCQILFSSDSMSLF